MAVGSCLCGAVAFEVDLAGVVAVVECHCEKCRKVSGSASGVYFQVRKDAFHWLCDDPKVATYESSPGNLRGFCPACGCVAPVETGYSAVRVPGGAFDEDPGVGPEVVIFSEARAPWCAPKRDAHVFDERGPPEYWQRMVVKLTRPA